MIVMDNDVCSNIEVFKSKVRQNFMSTNVDIPKHHFEILGYEKVNQLQNNFCKVKPSRHIT